MNALLQVGLHNAVTASILALFVFLVTRKIRHAPLCVMLWSLVLIKLIMPPLVHFPVAIPVLNFSPDTFSSQPDASPDSRLARATQPISSTSVRSSNGHTGNSSNVGFAPATIARDTNPTLFDSPKKQVSWKLAIPSSTTLVFVVWFGISVAIMLTTVLRHYRFSRLLLRAESAGEVISDEVQRLAREIGLASTPLVRITNAQISPVLIGFKKPIILLPAKLMSSMDCSARRTVIAHELAHLHRRDHWRVWFDQCVVSLYWWHPIAWLARKQIRLKADECCDGWVLHWLPGHGIAYAESIMATIDYLAASGSRCEPGTTNGFGQMPSLSRRFKMVLDDQTSFRLGTKFRGTLMIGAVILLVFSPRLMSADHLKATSADGVKHPTDKSTSHTTGQPLETAVSPGNGKAEPKLSVPNEQSSQRKQVDEAIARGVRFLKSQQTRSGTWMMPKGGIWSQGLTGLCLLALLESGEESSDEAVASALNKLRTTESSRTYIVALETVALVNNNNEADVDRVKRNVRWLVDTQTREGEARGGWSYGPMLGKRSDGSNSRYAVWALDVARRAGIDVPEDTWRMISEYWLSSQSKDGAWGYQGRSMGSVTMALSGIVSLSAVSDALDDKELDANIRRAIDRAWEWSNSKLEKNQDDQNNPWRYYLFHVRAMADRAAGGLTDVRRKQAATAILNSELQQRGEWAGGKGENNLVATSFAILALKYFQDVE